MLHTKPALRALAHRLNEYLLEFQGDSSSAVQTTMVHNGLAALGNDLQDTLWFTLLSPSLGADFDRYRYRMPNDRFP